MERIKINTKNFAISLIVIWLIVILGLLFFYNYYSITDIKELPAHVIVGGDVGFNVSKTDLNFGIVPRNAVGHRSISLFSPEKVKVNIAVKGNIKNLLVPSENNFVLLGNKTLMFNLKTLGDTVYGNYSGKVILTFRDTYT